MSNNNKTTKTVIILMIVTIVTKILGFGREMALANIYGTTFYSDAYLTSMNIPIVMFAIVGTGINTTFIPVYGKCFLSEGKVLANKYTSSIINIVISLCIIISMIGIIFTKQFVKIFAMGFEGDVLDLTIIFTRFTLIGIIFTGISYVLMAYLQSNDEFIVPGIVGLPKNIIIIVSIIMSSYYGIGVMIFGTLIGMATDFIIQIPSTIKKGFKYEFIFNIKNKYVKDTVILLSPVIIGVGINQVNGIIDRSLASTLGEGGISALNYANRLNGFIIALFVMSIISIVYPKLAKIDINNQKEKFDLIISKYINIITLLIIPVSAIIMTFSDNIVKILFQRGQFNEQSTETTSIVLLFYSIGMIAFGIRELLNKIFYSISDTKTPMINGSLSILINILLNIVLSKYMGVSGLALATSISAIFCVILLLRSLVKKQKYNYLSKNIKVLISSLGISIIMCGISYLVFIFIKNYVGKEMISLIIALIFGGIIYIYGIMYLKIEEVKIVFNILKKKLRMEEV